jgi:hypothetical protein
MAVTYSRYIFTAPLLKTLRNGRFTSEIAAWRAAVLGAKRETAT